MSKSKITIRETGVDDVPTLVALNQALFYEDAGQRDPFMNLNWPQEEGEGYFRGHMERERSVGLLAEIDGTAVGYLIGYLRGDSTLRPVKMAELESMFVQETYRGQGIGERLVRSFHDWVRERGAERVSVTAYAANEGALAFYRRLGFALKNVTLELGLSDAA